MIRSDAITIRKDAGEDSGMYVGRADEQYVSIEGAHFLFQSGEKLFYDMDGTLVSREKLYP